MSQSNPETGRTHPSEKEKWDEIMNLLGMEMEYEVKPNRIIQRADGTFAGLGLGYLQRHHVQDRLDEVLGIDGWQVQYRVVDISNKIVECTISISVNGQDWIDKSDVGAPQGMDLGDEWKAAYTDAFKRAATQLGVGRFLYYKKPEWKNCEVVIRDGNPLLNKNGNFIFRRWLDDEQSTSDMPEEAYTQTTRHRTGEPATPEGRKQEQEKISMLQPVMEVMERYGSLACKLCGSTDTEVRFTKGSGKTPRHLAVWCNNVRCGTRQYRGYSYPLDDAYKYNQDKTTYPVDDSSSNGESGVF